MTGPADAPTGQLGRPAPDPDPDPRARAARQPQEDHRDDHHGPQAPGRVRPGRRVRLRGGGGRCHRCPGDGRPGFGRHGGKHGPPRRRRGAPGPPGDPCSFADIYALVGPESTGFATWADGQEIAAALGSSTVTLPDLPLSITAPGEESGHLRQLRRAGHRGTRRGAGHRPRTRWTTTPTTPSSSNDNAIIEGIAGSAGSFGWVGFAFYEENLDTVRPSRSPRSRAAPASSRRPRPIADNSYPISRDLYIYVNKAKAAANPAVTAYVDYYLADGTISTALETVPYVNLAPEALADAGAPGTARAAPATLPRTVPSS